MEKYIVPVHMGDGCTWSATEYVAFECESLDKLKLAFDYALVMYLDTDMKYSNVVICGSKIDLQHFVYIDHSNWKTIEPSYIPMDEWFEDHKKLEW